MFTAIKVIGLALILALIAPDQLVAEIYKWTDDSGRVHYSDQKPESEKTETVTPELNTYTAIPVDPNLLNEISKSNDEREGAHHRQGKKVVMYSTEWCGNCKKARRYFIKNGIPFVEYDIEKNKKAMKRYLSFNTKGVPLILIGKKQLLGFSRKRFESIYP